MAHAIASPRSAKSEGYHERWFWDGQFREVLITCVIIWDNPYRLSPVIVCGKLVLAQLS